MAKIAAYKFINPGSVSNATPEVKAHRKQLLATNRIGVSLNGISNILGEMEKNSALLMKAQKQQAVNKKRKEQRERDRLAEQRQESANSKLDTQPKEEIEVEPKQKNGFLESLGKFFEPFAKLFADIVGLTVLKGVLDWVKNPENREKLKRFIENMTTVFKAVQWFATGTITNVLEGFSKLTDPNADFWTKVKGFGQLLLGLIGLRYLLNPFKIIEDISRLLELAGKDRKKRGGGGGPDTPDRRRRGSRVGRDGRTSRQRARDIRRLRNQKGKLRGKGIPCLPGTEFLPDGKPKKPMSPFQVEQAQKQATAALTDTAVDLGDNVASVTPAKKGNAVTRFFDTIGSGVSKGFDALTSAAKSTWGLTSKWAQEAYAGLSEAARKRFEQAVTLGKRLKDKSLAAASAIGNKVGNAKDFVTGGLSKLGDNIKKIAMEKVFAPIAEFFKPLTTKLQQIGSALQDKLFGTPLGKKAGEALKKKGLFPPLDNIGPLAKKLGGKALPIIGGAINMLFAYDRFQGQDPFGGLLEALSAGFDLSGLAGFAAGPGISLGIDAYMFARDLIPGIMEFEEGIINAIPGAKFVGDKMKEIGSKLPPLGQLIPLFGGTPSPEEQITELPQKSEGGPVNLPHRIIERKRKYAKWMKEIEVAKQFGVVNGRPISADLIKEREIAMRAYAKTTDMMIRVIAKKEAAKEKPKPQPKAQLAGLPADYKQTELAAFKKAAEHDAKTKPSMDLPNLATIVEPKVEIKTNEEKKDLKTKAPEQSEVRKLLGEFQGLFKSNTKKFDTKYSQSYALSMKDADTVPVAVTIPQITPLSVPVPINTGTETIVTKKSPLLEGS